MRRAGALVIGVALAACGLDVVGVAPNANGVGTSAEAGGLDGNGGPPTALGDGAPSPEGGGACGPATDVQSNADHCGACGHSCRGATCVEGVCTPTRVMSGLSAPHGIAMGSTDVYVVENAGGRILRAPKEAPTGGVGTLVFDTRQAPRALAFGGGRLYWPEQTKLRSVTTNGTEEASRPLQGGTAVVIAGAEVYFNDVGDTSIWSSPLGLAAETRVAGAAAGAVGIAADNDFVYWTETGNLSRRVRTLAQLSERWIASEVEPESLAIGGEFIFWTTRTAIRASTRSVPSAVDRYAGLAGRPRALIHDNGNLYWFDTAAKTLVRASAAGGDGTKLVLAPGVNQQDFPLTTAIATDDTWVYWLSSADGVVNRVAK